MPSTVGTAAPNPGYGGVLFPPSAPSKTRLRRQFLRSRPSQPSGIGSRSTAHASGPTLAATSRVLSCCDVVTD
ncbi:hypothetical protein E4U43_002052 [Claviceps pusilla]|uniref:Uncharacterized protein n=1 Tax=Claviceps pusilla TaxID=123648 RepID=A0A9P7N972_9HYPO|nr:hypothetical protein E4U43_002052 [Claviceps pusilla]